MMQHDDSNPILGVHTAKSKARNHISGTKCVEKRADCVSFRRWFWRDSDLVRVCSVEDLLELFAVGHRVELLPLRLSTSCNRRDKMYTSAPRDTNGGG
eukprot:2469076-Rhodomonas_salina.1